MATECPQCHRDILGTHCYECVEQRMSDFTKLMLAYAKSTQDLVNSSPADSARTMQNYAQTRSDLLNYVRPFFTKGIN